MFAVFDVKQKQFVRWDGGKYILQTSPMNCTFSSAAGAEDFALSYEFETGHETEVKSRIVVC